MYSQKKKGMDKALLLATKSWLCQIDSDSLNDLEEISRLYSMYNMKPVLSVLARTSRIFNQLIFNNRIQHLLCLTCIEPHNSPHLIQVETCWLILVTKLPPHIISITVTFKIINNRTLRERVNIILLKRNITSGREKNLQFSGLVTLRNVENHQVNIWLTIFSNPR